MPFAWHPHPFLIHPNQTPLPCTLSNLCQHQKDFPEEGFRVTLLLLQMSIVLLVAMAFGRIARLLGQPRVVGEMIGGILLGRLLFGRFAPQLFADLFPQSSLAQLELLSTVGLVLFLFLIGLELDYDHLVRQRSTAIAAGG